MFKAYVKISTKPVLSDATNTSIVLLVVSFAKYLIITPYIEVQFLAKLFVKWYIMLGKSYLAKIICFLLTNEPV